MKCVECEQILDDKCFIKNFRPYCKDDYLKYVFSNYYDQIRASVTLRISLTRIFAVNCQRCKNPIKRKDMILKCKTYTYHYDCFTCDLCNKRFMPGEEYQFNENLLICKKDLMNLSRNPKMNEDSYGSSVESPSSACARQVPNNFADATGPGSYKEDFDYSMEHEGRLYIDDYGCSYTRGEFSDQVVTMAAHALIIKFQKL